MSRFVVSIEKRRRICEIGAFSDHRDAQSALYEALRAAPVSRRRSIYGRVTDSLTGDLISAGRAWNGSISFI